MDANGLSGLILRAEAWRLMAIARSTALRHEAEDPEWPQPVQLSPRRVAYRAVDVQRWIDSRPKATPDRCDTAVAVAARKRKAKGADVERPSA